LGALYAIWLREVKRALRDRQGDRVKEFVTRG
jgi:hypothetical protein